MSLDEQEGNVQVQTETLPEGIKHIHGAMYLVRFDSLVMPDPDVKEENKYEFRNPRTLTKKGQSDLFDKQNSTKIRESIRERTLLTPFLCRWLPGGRLQMVGGERRHRALSWLIHKKELVKDPRSVKFDAEMRPEYEWNPADQVYEFVFARCFHAADDLEALALSYTENDCRINQGAGNDVAIVMELRQSGASDERIMAIMSKDEKWLRDTDRIINGLDETTLNDVIEDNIEREAALELLSIREKYDDEVQAKALALAKESAAKDYKKRFERFARKLEAALTEKELAEGAVAEAAYQGDGTQEEAEAKASEAAAKVQRLANDKNADKPKVSPNNVKSGLRVIEDQQAEDNGATKPPAPPRALRHSKIKECYYDPLEELVKKGGKHPDFGDGIVASPDAIKLAMKLVKGIMDSDVECIEIVRLHYKRLSG